MKEIEDELERAEGKVCAVQDLIISSGGIYSNATTSHRPLFACDRVMVILQLLQRSNAP